MRRTRTSTPARRAAAAAAAAPGSSQGRGLAASGEGPPPPASHGQGPAAPRGALPRPVGPTTTAARRAHPEPVLTSCWAPSAARSEGDVGTAPAAASPADPLAQLKKDAKKARVDALWEQLSGPKSPPAAPVRAPSLPRPGGATKPPSSTPVQLGRWLKVSAPNSNHLQAWMVSLGLVPKTTSTGGSPPSAPPAGHAESKATHHDKGTDTPEGATSLERLDEKKEDEERARERREAARAALQLVASAAASNLNDGKVKITEVKDFAGEKIEVVRMVEATSKAAQLEQKRKAEMQAASSRGLDAMLEQIEKKKKLSIIDKSRKDWGEYKDEKGVVNELEEYKKSSDQYLDKVAFLGRAELREYEKEREERLGGARRPPPA
eukprot:SM000162S02353  [mRNA]  locus=s162:40773:42664:- [translate_table: standard]